MQSLLEDIKNGAIKVPWHNSEQTVCEIWTAEEFIQLCTEAKEFITQQRFYSDGLEEMVKRAKIIDEVKNIIWGIDLPIDIQNIIIKVITEISN